MTAGRVWGAPDGAAIGRFSAASARVELAMVFEVLLKTKGQLGSLRNLLWFAQGCPLPGARGIGIRISSIEGRGTRLRTHVAAERRSIRCKHSTSATAVWLTDCDWSFVFIEDRACSIGHRRPPMAGFFLSSVPTSFRHSTSTGRMGLIIASLMRRIYFWLETVVS